MNNLTTFNNDVFGSLRTTTINEELYFVAADVAKALGYSKPQNAIATHVDEDDTLKQGIIDKLGREQQTTLINESGMYSLIFGSKLETAKQFKKWVTSEVLPKIRRAGCYISENAVDEAIDFNRKFNNNKLIKKTFSNADLNDLEELFNQYIELSAIERTAGRLTNKDRISACNAIEKTLKARHVDLLFEGAKPSQLMMLQEVLASVVSQREKLNNKMRGGVISNKTRRIKQLEEELAMTQDDCEDDYYFIDKSGFSANYMYSYGKDKVVKSAAYHRWISELNLGAYLPQTYPGVDFTQPLRITILFGHKNTLDTNNLGKSIIDQIADYYSFNDSLVVESVLSLHSYVESHDKGYMYVKIENI